MKLTSQIIKGLSVSVFVAAMCCNIATSKPAYPHPLKFTQPDGTEITVRKIGDERGHVYLTDDNKLIDRRGDTFYYAKVDASGKLVTSNLVARPQSRRTAADNAYLSGVDVDASLKILERNRAQSRMAKQGAPRLGAPMRGPGLFPGSRFPAHGVQKVCIVLVQYADKQFQISDPYDHFSRMLQETGYSDYGATGSAYDYFKDNSNGQFLPEFDVYGPITLAHNRSYYGGNDWSGNDQRPEEMVIEACQQLDATVDFSEYDRDGDGYIDNVYVFYAGQGEASYGGSDTVWPHSWEVTAAHYTPYIFDGVQLDRYACSNEWESARPDGIGTFVHEFSHVMGIPDLYATSYTSAFTPGSYSAMDYGPYNNDGCTPPAYGAFERYALSWMEPKVLGEPDNITLKNVTSNNACIVPTASENEFFLLENRQQSGWDAYIPGHGMLIWHIDYNSSVWNSNSVNNTASHQYVDIEEADNTQTEYSRDGDTFPGYNGVTSFTDDTKPSMRTWNDTRLNVPITDITESGGIIRFKVSGGLPDVNPVEVTAVEDITATTATISWTTDEHASHYLVSCFTITYRNDREVRISVGDWNGKNVGNVNTITITDLEPLTEYHVEVFSTNGVDVSPASPDVTFTTTDPTFDMLAPEACAATDVTSDSFTAHWTGLDDATDYYIDVFTRAFSDISDIDVCDFADGVANLPAGWSSSSRLSYSSASYCGEAIPSIRLNSAQAYVMSPTYDSDICKVSFWHRGSSASSENSIKVMAGIAGKMEELATVDIVNDKGGVTTVIENIPEGVRSIRIIYNEVEHKGSIAIDDIKVYYNREEVNVPLLDKVPTGSVFEYHVDGLLPATDYYYTLRAFDGTLTSMPSNIVKVTTLEGAGINDALLKYNISASGTRVTVNADPYQSVNIYDTTGRLIHSARTDFAGRLTVDLRHRGLYIIRISTMASKITL